MSSVTQNWLRFQARITRLDTRRNEWKSKMRKQVTLFEGERLTLQKSIALTADSLNTYGPLQDHWAIAFSGGKDSTATVAVTLRLIAEGKVQPPKRLTVVYADTGMEAPPLHYAAMNLLKTVERMGYHTQIVKPEIDNRFFVYMLGRGVPPPKNSLRWCTRLLKVKPMSQAMKLVHDTFQQKILMLTGVRIGESAARDQRIALSCSKDGAECGQGYFLNNPPTAVEDKLAPIVHWRVCHVWDYLTFYAPAYGFDTQIIAEVYGGSEAEEINARTGCMECRMVTKDTMMERILSLPNWSYLAPIQRLRPLYDELQQPYNRIRASGLERRKDGELLKRGTALGPLTMEARRFGLSQVLAIQDEVNAEAFRLGRPEISLIDEEEQERILALIESNTWPLRWTGEEERGDLLLQRQAEQARIETEKYSLWNVSIA